ncbi:MAG: CvpA family protein [Desulfobulbaceae bacterium]|nr:CvpA family protein [Desulfobulbaceae bacterium]
MTAFDAIILIIFLLFLGRGIWVGLIGQLAFLVALPVAFLAAGAFYGRLGHLLLPVVPNPQSCFLLTYVLLFVATYLLIILIGKGLKMVMNVTLLGWFDRLMGGLLGLGKAAFLCTLLFMTLSGFTAGPRSFFSNSLSTPYLATSSEYMLTMIQDQDLRHRFLPKKPAISELLTPTVPAGKPLAGNTKVKPKQD